MTLKEIIEILKRENVDILEWLLKTSDKENQTIAKVICTQCGHVQSAAKKNPEESLCEMCGGNVLAWE